MKLLIKNIIESLFLTSKPILCIFSRMRKTLQFDVFGQRMVVVYSMGGWKAYYLGEDGERRAANIKIPSQYTVSDITQYLDDMFHESATEKQPKV